MKRKVTIAIIGATVGILLGMLIFINLPGKKSNTDTEVESTQEEEKNLLSKTGNTVLDDEYSVVEIETGEYIEDQVEENTRIDAGGLSEVSADDMSYNLYKAELLDSTVERATSYVYAAADTDVYAEMSLTSEILGQVKFNEKLVTYGSVDGWYVIDYNGQDGFIPNAYISDVENKEQVKVSEPVEKVETPSSTESSSGNEKTDTKETTTPSQPEQAQGQESTTTPPAQQSSDIGGLTQEDIAALDELGFYSGPVAEEGAAPSLSDPLTEEEKELTKNLHWQ